MGHEHTGAPVDNDAVTVVVPDDTATDEAVPGMRLGRYVVVGRVGAGGMSVVFAAYDPELDRKVAIKVLQAGAGGQARLVREARALARLSHPHVIPVHDVGTIGARVFLVEEYVNGGTLTAWMRAQRRRPREVLDVFMKAGQGLAAAHAAGLVHRDFKPDNVLLGRDGRVRVVDFGLVRPIGEAAGAGETPAPDDAPGDETMTRSGAILGTPAYMAPEQHAGQRVDARADQFSFCLALFEALHGAPAFEGQTRLELARAVTAGEVKAPPSGSDVPPWLDAVVLRGLRVDPDARYPSMSALLAELGRDPARVRRRLVLAAGAALLAAGGVWLGGGMSAREEVCAGAAAKLDGVWDGERRISIHGAFLATGAVFAEDAWRGVQPALDRWASGWVAMHEEACRATRVRGEQSEALLDQRMACLARQRDEVGAFTSLLVRADRDTVANAVAGTHSLPALRACADLDALVAPVTPPAPAIAAVVASARRTLDVVLALRRAGRTADGLAAARLVALQAAALGYAPLVAESRYLEGVLLGAQRQRKPAADALYAAAWAAEAARDDARAALAHVGLVAVLAIDGDIDEGRRAAGQAAASLGRLGAGHDDLAADLELHLGQLSMRQGRYDDAFAQMRAAVSHREEHDPDSVELARGYLNLGIALDRQGRHEAAVPEMRKAIGLFERLLGPLHPSLAEARNSLGGALVLLGRHPEAVTELRRAQAIFEQSQIRETPSAADNLHNLGVALSESGKQAEALEPLGRALAIYERAGVGQGDRAGLIFSSLSTALEGLGRLPEAEEAARRSLALREQSLGPVHPDVGRARARVASVLQEQGKLKEALEERQRAVAIYEQTMGPRHRSLGWLLVNVADNLARLKRPRDALAAAERSLAILEETAGRDSAELVNPLELIAAAHAQLGEHARARASLERALALVSPDNRDELAYARFALALELWATGDRRRARELAEAARAAWAEDRVRSGEIEAWLRAHR